MDEPMMLFLKYCSMFVVILISILGFFFKLEEEENPISKYRKKLNKIGKISAFLLIFSASIGIVMQIISDIGDHQRKISDENDKRNLIAALNRSLYPIKDVWVNVDVEVENAELSEKLRSVNEIKSMLVQDLGELSSSFKVVSLEMGFGQLLPLGSYGDVNIFAPLMPGSITGRFSALEIEQSKSVRVYKGSQGEMHVALSGMAYIDNNGKIEPSLVALSRKSVRTIIRFSDKNIEKFIRRISLTFRNSSTGHNVHLVGLAPFQKIDYSKYPFIPHDENNPEYYFDSTFPEIK